MKKKKLFLTALLSISLIGSAFFPSTAQAEETTDASISEVPVDIIGNTDTPTDTTVTTTDETNTDTAAVHTPVNLSVSCPATGKLSITAQGVGSQTGFVLAYRLGTSKIWNKKIIATDNPSVNFLLQNLAAKNYYVSLRSYLTTGEQTIYSDWCTTIACTASLETDPDVKIPSSFTSTCKKNKQLKIKATANGTVTGFTIAYKRTSSQKWIKKNIKCTSGKLNYTLKNLKKKKYHVSVRAYVSAQNRIFYSNWCTTISIQAKKN